MLLKTSKNNDNNRMHPDPRHALDKWPNKQSKPATEGYKLRE